MHAFCWRALDEDFGGRRLHPAVDHLGQLQLGAGGRQPVQGGQGGHKLAIMRTSFTRVVEYKCRQINLRDA